MKRGERMADEKLLREMGERIAKRRKSLKFTQEFLAEKMNVSVQMISNLELGKKAIRPENLIKLSTALSVSTDYILTGKERETGIQELTEKIQLLPEDRLSVLRGVIEIFSQE